MPIRYGSDFAKRYLGQARPGLGIFAESRERIAASTDVDQLDEWVRRAVTIDDVEELFVQ